ncbi:MAG: hypothetical protein P2A85_00970 [Microcoleus anatoxicus]|uniref:hypothetical protein n=1 Tax=Microcoleus anatoxicus TaxID=2705319 RepID=UPI0036731758
MGSAVSLHKPIAPSINFCQRSTRNIRHNTDNPIQSHRTQNYTRRKAIANNGKLVAAIRIFATFCQ